MSLTRNLELDENFAASIDSGATWSEGEKISVKNNDAATTNRYLHFRLRQMHSLRPVASLKPMDP